MRRPSKSDGFKDRFRGIVGPITVSQPLWRNRLYFSPIDQSGISTHSAPASPANSRRIIQSVSGMQKIFRTPAPTMKPIWMGMG